MIYLLPMFMSLCPPGAVCIEYEPPAQSVEELQLAHIAVLEAQVEHLDDRHEEDIEKLTGMAASFERKRAGLIAGLSIATTAFVSLLAVVIAERATD